MNNTDEHQVAQAAYRLPAAAHYLGVSKSTVKKLVRNGNIRSIKINRTRVFPVAALDELLNAPPQ